MTTTLAKLEDMSIQHWLKEAILPLKWAEKIINVPLVYSPERLRFEAQIVWLPNFLEEGRGWVYFDPTSGDGCVINSVPTQEQTTRITVYNEIGNVIDPMHYLIDYKDGAIVANGSTTTPDGVPTTVDFTQHYVSVIDGWPGTDPPAAPIVAVESQVRQNKPFQLGGGKKSNRRYTLHIFATSSSERDDLSGFIHNAFYNKHIPVIDYRQGEPLNYNGTFNTTYSGTILKLHSNDDALLYFDNVRDEPINARADWSDINRWRAKITFTVGHYTDGLETIDL